MISRAPFATLTVTHDRLFLQRIANRILELDRRNENGLLSVKGDYTEYLAIKEELMVAQERREIILKNTLRRETEWLRRGAKARTTKQQVRIQRAHDLADDVQDLQSRNLVKSVRIDFVNSQERNPKKLIEAKSIQKKYGSKKLFENVNLLITPGTRSDNELLKTDNVAVLKISEKESLLKVTLKEGKNREIRRVFESLGNEVVKLKRISFGDVQLNDLKPGAFEKIQKVNLEKYFPKYFKK